jgi:hypothetical protein
LIRVRFSNIPSVSLFVIASGWLSTFGRLSFSFLERFGLRISKAQRRVEGARIMRHADRVIRMHGKTKVVQPAKCGSETPVNASVSLAAAVKSGNSTRCCSAKPSVLDLTPKGTSDNADKVKLFWIALQCIQCERRTARKTNLGRCGCDQSLVPAPHHPA